MSSPRAVDRTELDTRRRARGLERWARFKQGPAQVVDLVDFHADNKMAWLAHSPSLCRDLGRIVAEAGKRGVDAAIEAYEEVLARCLAEATSSGKHTNVLQHLIGMAGSSLDDDARADLHEAVEQYRLGERDLASTVRALQIAAENPRVMEWVRRQTYLALESTP